MAIGTSESLKVVQEIILPGDVVALNIFYWWTIFSEDQTEAAVMAGLRGQIELMYDELGGQVVSGAALGTMFTYKRVGLTWDLIGSRSPDDTFVGTGEMMPHGVAGLLRAYTVHPRVIGRKYLPGLGEGVAADGVFDAEALAAMAAFAALWATTIELSTGNELWAGVWSTVFTAVTLMSGVMVVPVHPGYQRRRRPGVGM